MAGPAAPPSPVGALIVFVAAAAAAGVIVFGALSAFGWMAQQPGFASLAPAMQESLLTIGLFGLLALVAIGGLWLGGGFGDLLGRAPVQAGAVGLGLGLAGVSFSVVLAAIAGSVGLGQGNGGNPILLVVGLLLVAFQAGVEELYFRGWMQPALQRGWGRWPGIAAAALAFAGLHTIGGELSLVSILNLALGGIWFGLLADRSGGIVLPAAAHFAWNWGEASIYGLTPNPGVGNYGTLVDLEMAGSALWGGSAEGLNASLAMTFVMVAMLVLAVSWPGRTTAPVAAVA